MLVLFDLDDTLLDDLEATRTAAEVVRKRFRPDLGVRDFQVAWERSVEANFQRYIAGALSFPEQRRARVRDCVDDSLTDAQAEVVFDIYLAAYEASWTVFPDVWPGLAALKGHKFGLISNGESVQQRKKLDRTGLKKFFPWVVTPEDCGATKPSPQIFEFACRKASVPVSAAMYVGDRRETDAQAATDAGLVGIWLDRRGEAPVDCPVPVIGSLLELPPHVETRG